MKRLLYLFLFFCFTYSTTYAQDYLISSELIQSLSLEEVIGAGASGALYGVDVYKVIYNTIDVVGNPTTASGAMVLPTGAEADICFPVMVYHHGTVLIKDNVPSRLSGEILVGYISSADGYVTVMPDYLGLGDSPGLHPYVHADSEASASIDMLRAVREYASDNSVPLNNQLFLTGYSQGGHACMATHKMMEEQFLQEFVVTASAPCSGPYDMSGVSFEEITEDEAYATGGYIPYLLFSYQSAYGNLYTDLSEVLKSPYDETLLPLFDGTHEMSVVHEAMPAIPTEIFQDDYLEAVRTDANHPYRIALQNNDLHDWLPNAPVRMYYCEADEQVSYLNSISALETMQANGATNVEVQSAGAIFTHGPCATFALLGAKLYFDDQKVGCTETGIFDFSNDFLPLQFAPNPTSNVTRIEFDNSNHFPFELLVRDISGKVVYWEQNIHSDQVYFHTQDLGDGIYLVELRGTQVYRGKLMIH